jgi:hypothetical protein
MACGNNDAVNINREILRICQHITQCFHRCIVLDRAPNNATKSVVPVVRDWVKVA